MQPNLDLSVYNLFIMEEMWICFIKKSRGGFYMIFNIWMMFLKCKKHTYLKYQQHFQQLFY